VKSRQQSPLALIVVGALLGRTVVARWLIAAGLLILAAGNFWMSQLNLDIRHVRSCFRFRQ
jgi:hypothetical protein